LPDKKSREKVEKQLLCDKMWTDLKIRLFYEKAVVEKIAKK